MVLNMELLSDRTCDYSLNVSNKKLNIRTVIEIRKQTDFPLVLSIFRKSFLCGLLCIRCAGSQSDLKYSR